ncbi:uncharacterized protein LOC107826233 [Nicotiana tabacum]|uniref:Uncharacterized protein LOC107826233 n=1 Tax=Nicotiana tabacum TaxID=4097 RepID=A0A1S4D5R1_TOBAC|nr:PREDICTED: uncharacterized protein LOC107826233 isoform X2 [Nicotiana tabacum]
MILICISLFRSTRKFPPSPIHLPSPWFHKTQLHVASVTEAIPLLSPGLTDGSNPTKEDCGLAKLRKHIDIEQGSSGEQIGNSSHKAI